MLFKRGDRIGIVNCSNAQSRDSEEKLGELKSTLSTIGLEAVFSDFIYEKYSVFSGEGYERGKAVMDFYADPTIKAIFDISGGDVANDVLDYLNFDFIKQNPKPFFGYSDLSTILNAIYTKTGIAGGLYQIKNLVYGNKEEHIKWFTDTFFYDKNDLFDFKYRFLQGDKLEGIAIGGNIRCFLKLAGTAYMPAFRNKVLVLESLLGNAALMTTAINQYRHMGAFKEIRGILVGTFTNMEKEKISPNIEEIILKAVGDKMLPIARTDEIGHQSASKCIMLGKPILLEK